MFFIIILKTIITITIIIQSIISHLFHMVCVHCTLVSSSLGRACVAVVALDPILLQGLVTWSPKGFQEAIPGNERANKIDR